MKFVIGLVVLLLSLSPALAQAWPGTVVSVHDGDTFTVRRENGEDVRIRLFGVDCPELPHTGRWGTQPYSKAATKFVKKLFRNKRRIDVAIWEMGESYGRVVGGVIILDSGETVQELLVNEGLAWVDPRYCKRAIRECQTWLKAQEAAQTAHRGLWKDAAPVPPWDWRKNSR